jgi:hypothetical protein
MTAVSSLQVDSAYAGHVCFTVDGDFTVVADTADLREALAELACEDNPFGTVSVRHARLDESQVHWLLDVAVESEHAERLRVAQLEAERRGWDDGWWR